MNPFKKVFVSYAHSDREAATRLVAALREKLPQEIEFILDAGVVMPGDNLFVKIADTLSQADALLVIVSQASSSSNWVRSEVAWALAQQDGKLPIIPILIGSADAVPHLLKTRVYIDFTNEEKFNDNVLTLAKALLQDSGPPREDIHTSEKIGDLQKAFIDAEIEHMKMQQEFESASINLKERTLSISLLFFMFLLLVAAGITVTVFHRNGEYVREVIVIILPLVTGLVSVLLGFYFGRRSSKGSNS